MAGSATLGTSLVDQMAGVADDLRELHDEFGTRVWRVYHELWWWPGTSRGSGVPILQARTEITPIPKVTEHRRRELEPEGSDEVGNVTLTEFSRTYLETEVRGTAAGESPAANEAWFYCLEEAHGQGQAVRYFQVGSPPPYEDLDKENAWVVHLRKCDPPESGTL